MITSNSTARVGANKPEHRDGSPSSGRQCKRGAEKFHNRVIQLCRDRHETVPTECEQEEKR